MAKDDPQFITLSPEQFAQIVGSREGSDDYLRKMAEFQAQATKKALRPENEQAPGISAFNPLGERDHPRPKLKCKMFWVGYPLEIEALTREEATLLNRVEQVGQFTFTRADGSPDTIEVRGTRDANGTWQQIEFLFACQGDKKNNLPPMTAMLRDILGLGSEADELRKRVAELEAIVA